MHSIRVYAHAWLNMCTCVCERCEALSVGECQNHKYCISLWDTRGILQDPPSPEITSIPPRTPKIPTMTPQYPPADAARTPRNHGRTPRHPKPRARQLSTSQEYLYYDDCTPNCKPCASWSLPLSMQDLARCQGWGSAEGRSPFEYIDTYIYRYVDI